MGYVANAHERRHLCSYSGFALEQPYNVLPAGASLADTSTVLSEKYIGFNAFRARVVIGAYPGPLPRQAGPRLRRPDCGRKSAVTHQPELPTALEKLIEDAIGGDPIRRCAG